MGAQRLHGDDTPVLAKGKTDTARAWVYVRDDAPFAGSDPPAALFRYSRTRSGSHPVEHLRGFAGLPRTPCEEAPTETQRITGAVYRASGWIHVGTRQGRGRYDREKLCDSIRSGPAG